MVSNLLSGPFASSNGQEVSHLISEQSTLFPGLCLALDAHGSRVVLNGSLKVEDCADLLHTAAGLQELQNSSERAPLCDG